MKKFLWLILFANVGFTLFSQSFKVGNLSIFLPEKWNLGWYDGDTSKYHSFLNRENFNDIHITIFRKLGNSNVEYNPTPADINNIENHLEKNSPLVPNFYPHENRKSFINSLGKHVLDSLVLCEFESENIQFTRRIIFTDKIYCYVLTFSFPNMDITIPRLFTSYFKKSENSHSFTWKKSSLEILKKKFIYFEKLPDFFEKLISETNAILEKMILI